MAAINILAADSVSLSGSKILPKNKFRITSHTDLSNEEILSKFPDHDVLLIRSTRKIDKSFIDRCGFKMIATFTKGTDHIDMKAAAKRNVKVINAEEGNHVSAAEHTLAMILSIYKNIVLSDSIVRKNNFRETDFQRRELLGKTIGIIGFGKVGSYVGKLCRVFGINVVANDTDKNVQRKYKTFEFLPLNILIKESDIITLHIPFNKENEKFFSEKHFMKMKNNSVFINTSRGAVVDEDALIDALEKNLIYYAGLDVFMSEPLIDKRFFSMKNALLTNHIAGKTIESRERISEIIFGKIQKYFSEKVSLKSSVVKDVGEL
jgi:D-3-phosphoglycerate dehydrogenase